MPNSPSKSDVQRPQLVLYKYDSCPYCQKVMGEIARLGLAISMRDTMRDASARDELRTMGGKTQVPCLFIDGKALYESDAIIRYLQTL